MQEDSKRNPVSGLKRLILNEWPLLALLGAVSLQIGAAVIEMNSVVQSSQSFAIADKVALGHPSRVLPAKVVFALSSEPMRFSD